MKIIAIIGFIFISFYLFDQICIWLEKKGLLYYKNRKPDPGLAGKLMLELDAVLNPATRHVIEMKQNAVKHIRCEADVPGELKSG